MLSNVACAPKTATVLEKALETNWCCCRRISICWSIFSNILEQFQHIGRPGETILGSLGALGSTWSPKCGLWTIYVKKTTSILNAFGHPWNSLFPFQAFRHIKLGVFLRSLLWGHFFRRFVVRFRTILDTENIAFVYEGLQKSSFHRC